MPYSSGHCTAAFAPAGGSPANIGSTEDGFRVRQTLHHQPIKDDRGGDSEVDGVQMGADYEITLTAIEYNLIKAAIAGAVPHGKVYDNVGKLMTSLAGPLVLTPVTGTPNATHVGTTRTFHKAVPISDFECLLAAGLNKGPVTFKCYPDPANQDKVFTDVSGS